MGQSFNAYTKSAEGKEKVFVLCSKITEHAWWDNAKVAAIARTLFNDAHQVYWVGDYAMQTGFPKDLFRKIHHNSDWNNIMDSDEEFPLNGLFLVNETKKQFVDCDYYFESMDAMNFESAKGYVLHPLPILTAVGNGFGGGDYWSEKHMAYVGYWAGDWISVTAVHPDDRFEEIEPVFCERAA